MADAANLDAANLEGNFQKGLQATNIKKAFSTRSGSLSVLDGIDLEMSPGDTLAIVGPSGCGKSTLLHILGTLDSPSEGTVLVNGEDPFQLSEPQLAKFRNQVIGFVFQDHHLLPQLTVLENILMPTLAYKQPGLQSEEDPSEEKVESVEGRAHGLMDRIGLSDRKDHLPAELSGGERQRVAIARALILKPVLILCDEPTGNLDRATARAVGELLLEINREEQTMLIVVTHSIDLAGRLDRCLELDQGKLRSQ